MTLQASWDRFGRGAPLHKFPDQNRDFKLDRLLTGTNDEHPDSDRGEGFQNRLAGLDHQSRPIRPSNRELSELERNNGDPQRARRSSRSTCGLLLKQEDLAGTVVTSGGEWTRIPPLSRELTARPA